MIMIDDASDGPRVPQLASLEQVVFAIRGTVANLCENLWKNFDAGQVASIHAGPHPLRCAPKHTRLQAQRGDPDRVPRHSSGTRSGPRPLRSTSEARK